MVQPCTHTTFSNTQAARHCFIYFQKNKLSIPLFLDSEAAGPVQGCLRLTLRFFLRRIIKAKHFMSYFHWTCISRTGQDRKRGKVKEKKHYYCFDVTGWRNKPTCNRKLDEDDAGVRCSCLDPTRSGVSLHLFWYFLFLFIFFFIYLLFCFFEVHMVDMSSAKKGRASTSVTSVFNFIDPSFILMSNCPEEFPCKQQKKVMFTLKPIF